MNTYHDFIHNKSQLGGNHGFAPVWIPDSLFDFQKTCVDWSLRKGRAALFEECGLGKTRQEIVWAQNVVEHTNKPVLIATPIAVAHQFINEGTQIGVPVGRSRDGKISEKITVTNYQQLHKFNPSDFVGFVGDESGCLKNEDAKTTAAVKEFMRTIPHRLIASATPAPNDYVELGNSSEVLGELGYLDMLGRFFKSDNNTTIGGKGPRRWQANPFSGKFRFRGHAEQEFWRWVVSWARAIQKPSDIGGDDAPFHLPPLIVREHFVKASMRREGFLVDVPAVTLAEQREERRRTLKERCEHVARILEGYNGCSVSWCNLNDEGDLLEDIIPDAVQISGKTDDDAKEESLMAFQRGEIKRLISKGSLTGWGLNWQHCARQTYFADFSLEKYHQCVRRSWRFGQKTSVEVDIIASEGQTAVLSNLQRKAKALDAMFASLVRHMNNELRVTNGHSFKLQEEIPSWLKINR